MPTVSFRAPLFKIRSWTVLLLPKDASAKLPSRGMVMVEGTINGVGFQAPLEPDGRGSHWLKIEDGLLKKIDATVDDTVNLDIGLSKEWPRPDIPDDLKKALKNHPEAASLWAKITPAAQWEWLRWIRSTNKDETRVRRVEVACDKLKKGMRRPCCFNRALCAEPYVSKGGVLLEPARLSS